MNQISKLSDQTNETISETNRLTDNHLKLSY